MGVDETVLWDRLAQSRRAPLEPSWLGEVYSPSLS
ncbi:MAG: HEAT repeat domain-containing protein, partial [Synechococcus sp.]